MVRYGDSASASITPGARASTGGPASRIISRSLEASAMPTRACGIESASAAIAEANSTGSRTSRSGRHSSHAARMRGRAASTLSVPKISATTTRSASSTVAADCTRPQVGPSTCSGGGSQDQNG